MFSVPLITERCVLRLPCSSDIWEIEEYYKDPNLNEQFPWFKDYELDILESEELARQGIYFDWYIFERKWWKLIWDFWISREVASLIGEVWINLLSDNRWEWLGKEIMTEVKAKAFSLTSITSLHAKIDTWNKASRKLFNQLWFKYSWDLPQHDFWEGYIRDMVLLVLSKGL